MTDGLSEAYEGRKWDAFCENNELRMENDELRELVRDMWGVMWACSEQMCAHRANRCYRVRGNSDDVRGDGECWFETRMRDLGIEVDV